MESTQAKKENVKDISSVRKRRSARISLSIASHFLGRRLTVSRHLFSSGQFWKMAVRNSNCDVVMTFPQMTTEETLLWFLAHLKARVPELIIDVRQHQYTGVFGFYLTATYENLLKGAEDLRLRKSLKEEYGGGLKEFVWDEREYFENVDNQTVFLTTQERQSIILNMLYSFRAAEGDQLLHLKFAEGQAIIPPCMAEGILSQILPLHNNEDLDKLKNSWVKALFKAQPLDSICDYFGVKIAIYFAWLGHYTKALTIPAFFGFFMWISYYGKDQATEDLCFVVFALFNVLWATLYLESWKRHCAELAYRWGTLDSQNELLAEPRPLFSGPLIRSPVTGRMEPSYPCWRRNLFRYCVSLPVIAFCLFIVFIVMFLIFELQTWWDSKVKALEYPFWMTFLPKVLLGLVINVLDGVYHRIALWLNNKENYRLEEEYENHLIIKVLLFQFVNSFLSLFYIAFYLQDMEKLKEQLAALLITRQVVGNIKESVIPFLTESVKLAHLRVDTICSPNGETSTDQQQQNGVYNSSDKEERQLTQAEIESAMYKYEGTFEDYLEMFIQFGYVILFSSAFPMAGMCALMNNIIEIRSDAFKLCMIFQRPFGQRVENIGTWQDAMEFMGVIAVIVNCALIGMSGQIQRMFPSLSSSGTILLIIVLEHVILFLKFGIAYAIPDVPQWVATEMAKIEFHRREAAKQMQCSKLTTKQNRSSSTSIVQNDASVQTEACLTTTKGVTFSNECVEVSDSDACCGRTPSSKSSGTLSNNEGQHISDNNQPVSDVRKSLLEQNSRTSGNITTGCLPHKFSSKGYDSETRNTKIDITSLRTTENNADLDDLSISFEVPYSSVVKEEKVVHRKCSLPHLKVLKKSLSQESNSLPSSAPPVSEFKQAMNAMAKFFPVMSLKRKKKPLLRTLSLHVSQTKENSKTNEHSSTTTPLDVSSPKSDQMFVFPDVQSKKTS
ncbi:anoctamin-8 isoform X1 [Centruroides vittatus]|uniref:anoctamin-8 isoform X1 n=2 Tax=Centruroides vittatus TaxID=120091 RepID=UPI00350F4C93